ncbi:MAG: molecular chaperone [Micavibrio sp.]|mgnify:CR=1 FL=1|nr:molecular chaperone [Micavibrio sp.]|tara:strand:+ start:2138 stop:3166 length:1029 start_codon:yes stop_codon:yes gene_type:complete
MDGDDYNDAEQHIEPDKQASLGYFNDNLVKPFILEASNFRGRAVRMGSELDDILSAHDYPRPVAHLVAETLTLALLLSSMIKYEGIFTLQTQGDGPISMLVADVTSDGKVRACASYNEERLEIARQQLSAMKSVESSQNHLAQYLGKGYIAFTVDQGGAHERYQGVVDLHGASLVDCAQHYFTQSEQISTGIKMAVGQRDGEWRSAGIMLQKMPEDETVRFQSNQVDLDEDDWRRCMIFMESCTEEELLDPKLSPNDLLTRLFHEEGVRVFEPKAVIKECRCSDERVFSVLSMMSLDDREYMENAGKISMKCEFCSHEYVFDAAELEQKIKDMQNDSNKEPH